MSVMMKTVNPDAVERAEDRRAVPGLGDTVLYYFRRGEIYGGKMCAPAMVLASDRDNGLLKLMVIHDHADTMTFDNVPRRPMEGERGWDFRPGSDQALIEALKAEVDELRGRFEAFMEEMANVIFGVHDKPKASYEDRLRALEKAKSKK